MAYTAYQAVYLGHIAVTILRLSDNSHCRSAYYPAWIVCANDNGYCRSLLRLR